MIDKAVFERAKTVEALTGWKPPIIYDVRTDTFRLATQADISAYGDLLRAYGEVRGLLKKIEAVHERLVQAALREPA